MKGADALLDGFAAAFQTRHHNVYTKAGNEDLLKKILPEIIVNTHTCFAFAHGKTLYAYSNSCGSRFISCYEPISGDADITYILRRLVTYDESKYATPVDFVRVVIERTQSP